MSKKLPVICPGFNSGLKTQSRHCENCYTTIQGSYNLPIILKLVQKEQDYIIDFVKSSASLKDMAQKLKLPNS